MRTYTAPGGSRLAELRPDVDMAASCARKCWRAARVAPGTVSQRSRESSTPRSYACAAFRGRLARQAQFDTPPQHHRGASQALPFEQRGERRQIVCGQVCEEPAARCTDETGALQLRRIDILRHIAGGMNVAVRPVVHIDGRDAERAVGEHHVVTARIELLDLREQRLFVAADSNHGITRATGCERVALGIDEGGERLRHVVDEVRQAGGRARPWKTALVRGPPPTMSMWMSATICLARSGRAFSRMVLPSISGGQKSAAYAAGARACPGDQSPVGARNFENRRTPAGVVVRAGPGMIQMTSECDLLLSKRGSAPAIVAVTISYSPAWRCALTFACSRTVSPAVRRA